MNVYEAIMKAADWIEHNPSQFKFMRTEVPSDCNTPGCALGWIGYFAEPLADFANGSYSCSAVSWKILNVADSRQESHAIFYERMDAFDIFLWRRYADKCAMALRLYAAKYHAPEKPVITGIPESVRAIFDTEMAASH